MGVPPGVRKQKLSVYADNNSNNDNHHTSNNSNNTITNDDSSSTTTTNNNHNTNDHNDDNSKPWLCNPAAETASRPPDSALRKLRIVHKLIIIRV